MSSTSSTGSQLADWYKSVGREEARSALRTWLEAVKKELEKEADALDSDEDHEIELAETRGGIAVITVAIERLNEKSDAAPAGL